MFYDTDKIKSIIQKNISESLPDYDDGESPLELMQKQSIELRSLAESAKSQAESAKQIAESAKVQSDIALKVSNKSDIKGWISVIVAIFCAFMEFAVHHSEIIEFLKSLVK